MARVGVVQQGVRVAETVVGEHRHGLHHATNDASISRFSDVHVTARGSGAGVTGALGVSGMEHAESSRRSASNEMGRDIRRPCRSRRALPTLARCARPETPPADEMHKISAALKK